MPLTECPECGGKVSTRAIGCPHCKKKVAPSSTDIARRDLSQFIKKGDDTYVDPGTHELGSGSVLKVHDGDKKRIKLWGSLKDGRFHGPFETYDKTGQLKEKLTYKDGVLDGPYEEYHPNGHLEFKGNYDQGRTLWNEVREEYERDGVPISKRSYKDGKLHGPFEEYFRGGSSPGQLRLKGTHNDGVRDGPIEQYEQHWDMEEQRHILSLRRKVIFKNGKWNGPFELHEKGLLLRKGTHRDGKRHGPYEGYALSYDRESNLIEKGTYNMGVKCGEWTEERWWLWGLREKTYPPCPPDLEDET